MVSYGIQLRSSIYIIQIGIYYHKGHHECYAQGHRFFESGFYNRLNREKIMARFFILQNF